MCDRGTKFGHFLLNTSCSLQHLKSKKQRGINHTMLNITTWICFLSVPLCPFLGNFSQTFSFKTKHLSTIPLYVLLNSTDSKPSCMFCRNEWICVKVIGVCGIDATIPLRRWDTVCRKNLCLHVGAITPRQLQHSGLSCPSLGGKPVTFPQL